MTYQDLVKIVSHTQPPKMVFNSLTLPRQPEGFIEVLHCIVEDDDQVAADWALRLASELAAQGQTSIVNPDTAHQVPVFYNQPVNTDMVTVAAIVVWSRNYTSSDQGRGQNTAFAAMDSSGYTDEVANANQLPDGSIPVQDTNDDPVVRDDEDTD